MTRGLGRAADNNTLSSCAVTLACQDALPAAGAMATPAHRLALQDTHALASLSARFMYALVMSARVMCCRYAARPSKASIMDALEGDALYGVAPVLAALTAGVRAAVQH